MLASGLGDRRGGISSTSSLTSASSSGRSAVRSRRPQPPWSPPGLTVTPTHSSPPLRPARDRRARRPGRSPWTTGAHSGLSSCRRPDPPPRPRRMPPRAPPCRARRFTPLHAARASLPPCLAAHPGARAPGTPHDLHQPQRVVGVFLRTPPTPSTVRFSRLYFIYVNPLNSVSLCLSSL